MRTLVMLLFTCVLILVSDFSTGAQDPKETFSALRISYFGKSITRPGIKVGSACVLVAFKPHVRADGDEVSREIVLTPNIGIYYHFKNLAGLFVNAETGIQDNLPERILLAV